MVNFEGKTAGLRSFEGLIFRTILIILVCCHGPTPMSIEWWIPADDLDELNSNIVGLIEVIGEYK